MNLKYASRIEQIDKLATEEITYLQAQTNPYKTEQVHKILLPVDMPERD